MPESSREEIAKLEALYANNPEGRVFTHLAEAYRKTGDLDKARGILEQGLTRHAGYASAHVVLGRVLMDQHNSEEASAAFGRALELDPHNRIALHSLGDLSRDAGNRDEALRYYEQLRHLEPNNTELAEIISGLSAPPSEEPSPEVWEAPSSIEAGASAASEPQAEEREPDFEHPPAYQASAPSEPAAMEPEPATAWEPEPEPEPFPLPMGEIAEPQAPASGAQEATPPDLGFEWLPTDDVDFGLPGDLGELTTTQSEPEPLAEEPSEQAFVFDDFSLAMGADASQDQESGLPLEPLPEMVSDPEFTPNFEPEPQPTTELEPDAEPTGEVLTETIAELYSSQGLHDRAADVYRALLKQRPGDAGLEAKLENEEARATPSFEETPSTFESTGPEAIDDGAQLDSEAWLAGGAGTVESPPTPYAWTDQAAMATEDSGPAIRTYFERLLAYQPRQKAATVAEPDESFLDLDTVEHQPQRVESPVEVPVPPPNARPAEPVEAGDAFDAWFDEPPTETAAPAASAPAPAPAMEMPEPTPEPVAPPTPAAAEAPVAAAEPATGSGAEDDDDLEMFRSWLQSLKK